MTMKELCAVLPYHYKKGINYKKHVYDAWITNGGNFTKPHYPCMFFRRFIFNNKLPSIVRYFDFFYCRNARLRFVDPLSINLESFPDYIYNEIVPMIWDCWPMFYEKMFNWFVSHKVKTAIFCSAQTAEVFKKEFPTVNIIWCPEAVNVDAYDKGGLLVNRPIDLLEFGRPTKISEKISISRIKYVATKINGNFLFTDEQLRKTLSMSKVSIAYPRSVTQPDVAEGIETLTQRYWECMLSRTLIIGHCPKELEELIGYNPVVEINFNDDRICDKILTIFDNIDDYQSLVDYNREVALKNGDWKKRMNFIMHKLEELDYRVR